MIKLRRLLIGLASLISLLAIFSSCAYASATASEFEPCKKIAVKKLEACLAENPYYKNDSCWTESKTWFETCKQSVKRSYDRYDPAEKKAKREAARKIMMKGSE